MKTTKTKAETVSMYDPPSNPSFPEKKEPDTNYPFKFLKNLSRGKAGVADLLESLDNLDKESKYTVVMKHIEDSSNTTKDTKLYLSVNKIPHPDYAKHNESIEYNQVTGIYRGRGGEEKYLLSCGNGDFINQTCLHLILNEILKENENYVKQFDAFFCRQTRESNSYFYNDVEKTFGYNIMETCDKGDLSDFINKDDTIIEDGLLNNIMKDLLTPLSVLKCKKYGFQHGDLKCKNAFVKSNKSGDANKYIFKIADFDKSSIFWRNIRFYNNKAHYKDFSPHTVETFDKTEIKYYKPLSSLNLQLYTMFTHVPFFMSYDIYTLMISMMREPKIWDYFYTFDAEKKEYTVNQQIQDKSKFFKAWENLWTYDKTNTDELDKITDALKKLHMDHKRFFDNFESQNKYKMYELDKRRENHKPIIDNLVKLRSMGQINTFIHNNSLKMKVNIDEIYNLFGVPAPSFYDKQIDNYHEKQRKQEIKLQLGYYGYSGLGSYHVCTDKCKAIGSYGYLGSYGYTYCNTQIGENTGTC